MRGSTRFLKSGVIVAMLGGLSLSSLLVAATSFRSITRRRYEEIPVRAAALDPPSGQVRGLVSDGLPPFRLRWDGQPPSAILVEKGAGGVVAVPVLSEKSLGRNRNAVLWDHRGCRFVLEPHVSRRYAANLVLRCEAVESRRLVYLSLALFAASSLMLLIVAGSRRLARVPPGRRAREAVRQAEAWSFVLLACLAFAMCYPGTPLGRPSEDDSDEANINAFAAGLDRPEVFRKDALLSDPDNFAWYTPCYVGLVRLVGRAGFHYNTSRAFLAVATMLSGLFGYERLFTAISGSRAFGFAAALALCFLDARYPPNEAWVVTLVAPRTVFGALMPWVLLWTLRYAGTPRKWWIPAAASGLLFYVHPVSSPALTGAVLCGLLAAGDRPSARRLKALTVATAAATAVMIPYGLTYAAKYRKTLNVDAAVAAKALDYSKQRLSWGYYNAPMLTRRVARFLLTTPRVWLGGLAIVALARHRRGDRADRLLLGLLVGFTLVTYAIPFADWTVSTRLGRLPFEVDLVRGIRYFDVINLGLLALVVRRFARRPARRPAPGPSVDRTAIARPSPSYLAPAMCLVVAAAYGPYVPASVTKMASLARANWGHLNNRRVPADQDSLEMIRAVEALRGDGQIVFGPMGLRQLGIPLCALWKDLGCFSYANPRKLIEATEAINRAKPLLERPIGPEQAADLARISGADILVLSSTAVSPDLARSDTMAFRNDSFTVVRIPERSSSLPR